MEIDDSVGIDISKDFLDIHRLRDGKVACFPNGPSGFRSLSKWLGRDIPTRVIFEATGPYHRRFELAFSGKLPLVKVNPLQARRFAQACGTRVKTDAVPSRRCKHRLSGNRCACACKHGTGPNFRTGSTNRQKTPGTQRVIQRQRRSHQGPLSLA